MSTGQFLCWQESCTKMPRPLTSQTFPALTQLGMIRYYFTYLWGLHNCFTFSTPNLPYQSTALSCPYSNRNVKPVSENSIVSVCCYFWPVTATLKIFILLKIVFRIISEEMSIFCNINKARRNLESDKNSALATCSQQSVLIKAQLLQPLSYHIAELLLLY